MNSIRTKLIKNFLIVIVVTILILDTLTITFFKQYYYKNRQSFLVNQIESSINFYTKYFSDQTLIENIYDNVDAFWNNTNTQVEILDEKGNLLMDSIGIRDENILNTPDIAKAVNGEIGRWIGKVDYYESKVMIVSQPIKIKGETIGVMRVISSLDDIEETLEVMTVLFIIISIGVIVIGVVMSLLMANSIINPIKVVTDVASQMAKGNLQVRSNVKDGKEITQLSDTLNYMAAEVENRERLKDEFISSVSHELRTPLTAIKGWVITLNNEETDKETLALGFDIIEKETDRLTAMVEELLDFSKLVNGIIQLNKEKTDIYEFIKHIESYMMPRAIEEKINFKINIDNNIDNVYFDNNKIKQVLINIIDNAFKFTNEYGNVELNVNKDKKNIVFKIIDNGCGISTEDLPKVKNKFYKGKNSKSKNGIGLSICDEIIKLHDGKFTIYSELGKGTVVTIEIPSEGGKIYQ